MAHFLKLASGGPVFEHCGGWEGPGEPIVDALPPAYRSYRTFLHSGGQRCFSLEPSLDGKIRLRTSYFVGADWICPGALALQVKPKFDAHSGETDYFYLLNKVMSHPDLANDLQGLFQIFPEEPEIAIEHKQDLLTPLLIFRFLKLVKEIVRKGLKRTYYTVDQNLPNRVKGKILVAETVRRNHLKAQLIKTVCRYQVFGVDGPENRLLKKAVQFVRTYQANPKSGMGQWMHPFLHYVDPAFIEVSDDVSLFDVKHGRFNPFYQEYKEAIHLAKLILKRFGYTLSETYRTDTVRVPPFWVDMSRLFELYVLALLKDSFGSEVKYHFYDSGNELDFLLKEPGYQMVIDSKYKRYSKDPISKADAWQVSGYARLNEVYEVLSKKDNELIDALIIFPDPITSRKTLTSTDLAQKEKDPAYRKLFKLAVHLPQVKL